MIRLLLISSLLSLLALFDARADYIEIGEATDFDLAQPFDRFYSYSTNESIYLQSELGTPKHINSIAYNKGAGISPDTIFNVSIYMKHTSDTVLSTGDYSLTGYTLVYQGSFPNNLDTGWLAVNLSSPFTYNGSSNLQVLVIKGYQVGLDFMDAPMWRFTLTTTERHRGSSDDLAQPSTLWALPFLPDVKFGYTNALLPPALISPADLATNQSINPALSFNASLFAINYKVQLATEVTFTNILKDTIVASTSIQAMNLSYNTNYFWRVRAMNSTDTSSWVSRSFTTEQGTLTQNIPLNVGWNMISSRVTPQNTSISNIMSAISGSYSLIKNAYGHTYWPPFLTTLSQWNTKHAYQTRITTIDTLPIIGMPIVPEANPIPLTTGWYWLPYYRSSNMAPATALTSIAGHYSQVKSISGQVYWPPFFNSLTSLEPNKGYLIFITGADTLTYPANSPKASMSYSAPLLYPKVFTREELPNPMSMIVAIESRDLEVGDEIAAFDEKGNLVGSAVWQEAQHGLVVWGDDPQSNEKDGATEGEYLSLKVFKKEAGKIVDFRVTETIEYNGSNNSFAFTYNTDKVLKVSGETNHEQEFVFSATPNPASSETILSFGKLLDQAKVSIYNQTGVLVYSNIVFNSETLKVDLSSLPTGAYIVVLNSEEEVLNTKLTIVK